MKFERVIIVTYLIFGLMQVTTAQSQSYFQQEVNYDIEVSLNDAQHLLTGNALITYTNNAPSELNEIRMHLWGNAYKNKRTAFAKQKLRQKNSKFYFAGEQDLGGYTQIDFLVNGQKVPWTYHKTHQDIAILKLNEPLRPGASITISAPFTLKIPASFSRLGHVGTSYQMSQWYPKPAVFDQRGWHEMPYLDQGEFYSEFGSFRVRITLPENYVVGATGTLVTPSEQNWLLERIRATEQLLKDSINELALDFPASSARTKTIEYTASRVHDFAWFADKRFHVLTDTAILSDGRRIPTFAMFTNQNAEYWEEAASYIKRAVEFYSSEVGNYPWEHATAVQSALSAGGGMEYPMITVIGEVEGAASLDEVITHEVGHNWFYGVLASNERDHPWLDEGLNTFYEFKYMSRYYTGTNVMGISLPKFLDKRLHGNDIVHLIRFFQTNNGAVPPDTHSDESSSIQYGAMSYLKPALCLKWLEASMGEAAFRRMIQDYYQTWQFRHPQPQDLRAVFLKHNPKADWFFDQMLTKKSTNYAITSSRRVQGGVEVTVKNKSDILSPLPLQAIEDGHVVSTKWVEGFRGKQTITVPCPDADAVMIDFDETTIDLHRGDNYRKIGKPRMPGLTLLPLAPDPKVARLGITPVVLWNSADKTQVGAVISNALFPGRPFSFILVPSYSIASESMTGVGEIRYRYLPKAGKIQYIEFGLFGRTYHFDYNWRTAQYLRFTKLAPAISVQIPNNSGSKAHHIRARALRINVQAPKFDSTGMLIGKQNLAWPIHELTWRFKSQAHPNPYNSMIQLEQQSYKNAFGNASNYLKATALHHQSFYYKTNRQIKFRIFTGYFLKNTARKVNSYHSELARGSLSLFPQTFSDYKFDGMFLGRGDAEGFLARQIEQVDGGFKIAHGSSYRALGFSNDFAAAINLSADLPKKLPFNLPLKPYVDLGYTSDLTAFGDGRSFSQKFFYSGGVSLSFLKGGAEVFFPIFNSPELRQQYRSVAAENAKNSRIKWNYFHWISWSIKLKDLHPRSLMDDFSK